MMVVLFLAGCLSAERATLQQVTQQQIQPEIIPPPTPEKITPSSTQPVKEFRITAEQFQFTPSTITVKKGDKVRLIVTSTDVTHGLAIPEFKVNMRLEKGKEQTAEFTADKAGTFTFYCSVVCGSGHSEMEGTLIVNE